MEQYVVDPTIAYDVVELPSRGIFYPNKKKSVKVSYLTASDENILSSPNLLQTNTVIDELLKRKVLDKDVNVDELVDEDRQAILIFLRNTPSETSSKMLPAIIGFPNLRKELWKIFTTYLDECVRCNQFEQLVTTKIFSEVIMTHHSWLPMQHIENIMNL